MNIIERAKLNETIILEVFDKDGNLKQKKVVRKEDGKKTEQDFDKDGKLLDENVTEVTAK